ncbi:MAG: B12-binding domain-containing radical SAM protein [Thermodesulfobacteriota bacterium]
MNGVKVTLIDCLNSIAKRNRYEDGKFNKVEIEKPPPVSGIPRKYSQYGISEESFREKLSEIERPDLIGFASGMTYWYPGLFKSIKIIKEFFDRVPIILGGIYATLCHEHALKYSGVDYVIRGRIETQLFDIVNKLLNIELIISNSTIHQAEMPIWAKPNAVERELSVDINSLPYPAFDLYPQLHYVSVMTSRGCPFHCSYCASPILSEGFQRRDPIKVVEEIEYWTSRYKVSNIVFYDDALLVDPLDHIVPMLKEIRRRGIKCNFHAPNGLHVKEVTKEVAHLLHDCQFKTIRLGLETSNEAIQIETGGKVDNRSFKEALKNLKIAGYSDKEIGVYIMAGLPGQRVGEVEESIAFVKENGAKPILVEYSPIPQTPLFEKAKQVSLFDLENEPLYQNNSILPCQWEGFTEADFKKVKKMVKE